MTRGKSATAFNGAGFALEAHAAGVRLPAGDFTTVKETLLRQLTAYVSKTCDPDEPVKLGFHLDIEEEAIELILHAHHHLDVMVLKPVIERLNEFAAGLGWFVYGVISKAGGSYPIYNDAAIVGLCEMLWFDPGQTDADYASYLLDMNGELRANRTDEQIIEEFSAGYQPSHMQAVYAGEEWMLGSGAVKNGKWVPTLQKPRAMSLRDVKHLLQQEMPDDLRQVVIDALALRKQIKRKTQKVHGASHRPEPREDEEYYGQPYGASCIAVWGMDDIIEELIGHFEECEMNGGESDTVHMRFKADPNDQQSLKELVKSFKDVVAWHSAVGRVLKHFPKG